MVMKQTGIFVSIIYTVFSKMLPCISFALERHRYCTKFAFHIILLGVGAILFKLCHIPSWHLIPKEQFLNSAIFHKVEVVDEQQYYVTLLPLSPKLWILYEQPCVLMFQNHETNVLYYAVISFHCINIYWLGTKDRHHLV